MKTIKIGKQEWMAENLNVKTFRNGDPIPKVKSPEKWEESKAAWCFYKNNSKNGKRYGPLYNWNAINDGRGLAPAGWHVPSNAEWQTLVNYLGGRAVAGGKMKETVQWSSPNTGANNESGFSALPGGYRRHDGSFELIGIYGWFWTSTVRDYSRKNACYWALNYDSSQVYSGSFSIRHGYSVRCVRDHI
ncbi:MAG: fibrobacter succinogenes major paralogous domain-containing protein [Candidatus Aminicenantaceae bacterium]